MRKSVQSTKDVKKMDTITAKNDNNELPHGDRSSLAHALDADDPEALKKHLETCTNIPRKTLLSVSGKAVPKGQDEPWSCNETKISRAKEIDNRICIYLSRINMSVADLTLRIASSFGCVNIVTLLLSDKYRNAIYESDIIRDAFRLACSYGKIEVLKVFLKHDRVHPAAKGNEAIMDACGGHHVQVVKLLLEDKRIDPSAWEQVAFHCAIDNGNVEIIRLFLAHKSIKVTGQTLKHIDDTRYGSCTRVDALFSALLARFWPGFIENSIECMPRDRGHLRNKLDSIEVESSWSLLLCVKRRFTSKIAARVRDVLREVCFEWIRYMTVEACDDGASSPCYVPSSPAYSPIDDAADNADADDVDVDDDEPHYSPSSPPYSPTSPPVSDANDY